ncbi:PREDICTED: uncharacterized protein LOC104709633 [Camelina sativa]|uniref:Uncharacterized protein LOC104709633 n=1 Tax=Camelina sativa TaxID=90675 RepID=A0ABM0TD27_CAMSA|nr:PREDICTED: uncharacterized protein LOC104709633 [Camelina sativa]
MKGTKSIVEYFQGYTTRFDQLAQLGKPVEPEAQVEFILECLSNDYKPVVDQIESRDSVPSLLELHEKLLHFETKLSAKAAAAPLLPPTANVASYRGNNNNNNPRHQVSDRGIHGHSARRCSQLQLSGASYSPNPLSGSVPWQPHAHLAAVQPYNAGNWIMESGATHHLTSYLNNLSLHQPYNGGEDVTIADGSGMPISHTGSALLPTPTRSLAFNNVLCVPDVHKNLIYVYRLCNSKWVLVNFFPAHFQVTDLITRE